VAIIAGTKLRHPRGQVSEGPAGVDEKVSVTIHDPRGCPRYTARFIEGVRIGPSPVWLSRRLMAAGVRSINNVVDVTNYVMLEMGQPLHAFDYDLLKGGQIQVRRAQEGELFVTLDEKEHTLTPEILLICDAQRPVAIAGIMGGLESEVRPETANVLLESAYFEPTVIRRGSKALNISTESSQRFERGIDPNAAAQASDRAAQLIAELAGGTVAKGVVDQYPGPIASRKITLRIDRVNRLLGTRLTSRQIKDFLEGLEFDVSGKDPLEVVVPTFRPDITREIDLVEEVARLYGYDRIEATVQAGGSLRTVRQEKDIAIQKIKSALCGLGLQEVVTSSLVDPKLLTAMGITEPIRTILNPLSEDLSVLRPSLVPSILQVLQHNRRRDVSDVRIFEVGKVFWQPRKGESTAEDWSLCGLLAGKRWPPAWGRTAEPVDFFDLRGLIDSLMEKLSIDKFHFLPYDEGGFFQTGRAAAVYIGKTRCGTLGQVAPGLYEIFDLGPDVMLFELQIAPLAEAMSEYGRYAELPRFPAAERDLAIVVAEQVPAGEVEETIRQTGGQLVVNVHLFDLYRGKQIPSGKKGLAYSIRYQSPQKTLMDSEVEEIQEKILKALGEKFGAELRDS
jgi:phenylalanyl-tRNA synthetase beta chain